MLERRRSRPMTEGKRQTKRDNIKQLWPQRPSCPLTSTGKCLYNRLQTKTTCQSLSMSGRTLVTLPTNGGWTPHNPASTESQSAGGVYNGKQWQTSSDSRQSQQISQMQHQPQPDVTQKTLRQHLTASGIKRKYVTRRGKSLGKSL